MPKSLFENWDQYFMTMVYLIAMKSKDTSTKIGAVIVGEDNEIISTGFNGLPRGVEDDIYIDVLIKEDFHKGDEWRREISPELVKRHERPEKYFWYEHAERNAIYNAARIGVKLKGTKMYTQGIPCSDCARAIIQSGITKVIVHETWEKNNESKKGSKWVESAKRTKEMFIESCVDLIYYEDKYCGEIITDIYGLSDGSILV